MKINVHRRSNPTPRGTRVDPSVVREPAKPPRGACLACASDSRVAAHTCGRSS
jgi:hypothetical protein